MREPVLHIVFGAYGAKTLRKDVKVMSRPDEVVSFDDDLSYGPIEPLDPSPAGLGRGGDIVSHP